MAERQYSLVGEVDLSTVAHLRSELARVTVGDVDLLVDCAQLTFIDCSGIGVLVETQRALDARGNCMMLVNVDRHVYRVLDLLGLEALSRYDRVSC
jgi:anti-anti-sigma factor